MNHPTPLPPELRPDLEALMPEPVATVDADGFLAVLGGGYIPTHTKLYTAAQMREAIQAADKAATERAAALAPGLATDLAIKYAGGGPVDFETIAVAIKEAK